MQSLCALPECGAVFDKRGKRKYHSDECAAIADSRKKALREKRRLSRAECANPNCRRRHRNSRHMHDGKRFCSVACIVAVRLAGDERRRNELLARPAFAKSGLGGELALARAVVESYRPRIHEYAWRAADTASPGSVCEYPREAPSGRVLPRTRLGRPGIDFTDGFRVMPARGHTGEMGDPDEGRTVPEIRDALVSASSRDLHWVKDSDDEHEREQARREGAIRARAA